MEFIYYGIAFKFRLSNVEYKNDIKLNEFNNYEIYIINNYDGSLKNEMFINKEDEFILIINHIYCINSLYSSESVKLFNTNNNIENCKYAWYPSMYHYQLSNFAVIDKYAYLHKDDNKTISNANTKYIVELDLPIYENTFIDFEEEPIFAYFNTDDKYTSTFGYDSLQKDDDFINQFTIMTQDCSDVNNYVYNSKIDNIVSLYAFNHNDFEQKQYDYRQHNTYMVKYNNDNTNISDDIDGNNKLKI